MCALIGYLAPMLQDLMTDAFASSRASDRVVRCFWHGPFSPYEALCLTSFVAAGIAVELFSDGPISGLPPGVTCRSAREILDHDVVSYRQEFDGPSPALHANYFRYALLEKLGGWWIDTDIILRAATLPATDTFVARQSDEQLNTSVMCFPAGHLLMKAARERTASVLGVARWGETGPALLTELYPVCAPHVAVAPQASAYAIRAEEFQKFLLPEAREEVEARVAESTFVHLWNEMWRRAGIPKNIAPPRGCWLDRMFERYEVAAAWSDRLDATYVERWAALRRDRDHAGHFNLVHDREIARLRAALAAQQDASTIGKMIGGMKRRLSSWRD